MKLSEDARAYAEAIYGKALSQCELEGERERRQIQAMSTPANPQLAQMSEHFVKLTKQLIDARLESYIQAFKQDDLLIDEEDKDEIIEELKRIKDSHLIWATSASTLQGFGLRSAIPNLEAHIASRLERTLGEAAVDLNLARRQMSMDLKQRRSNQPMTHNIQIHGDNYGNIQQGGQGNTQILDVTLKDDDENK